MSASVRLMKKRMKKEIVQQGLGKFERNNLANRSSLSVLVRSKNQARVKFIKRKSQKFNKYSSINCKI